MLVSGQVRGLARTRQTRREATVLYQPGPTSPHLTSPPFYAQQQVFSVISYILEQLSLVIGN